MSKKESNKSEGSGVNLERRKFLKGGGAAVAAGLAVPILPGVGMAMGRQEGTEIGGGEDARAYEGSSSQSWRKPNIIIIMTDQERYPRNWPEGWAEKNLPNRQRLANHGLTFTNMCTAASMCSPSRATTWTGLYPAENGVTDTLQPGVGDLWQNVLQPTIPNMATMLASAGYDVEYRGKWHLTKDPTGTLLAGGARDLELFGFHGWDPPDSGTTLADVTFGGGTTNYDEWYATGAADFLKKRKSPKPFALIVSFTNPHDIVGYPGTGVAGPGWNAPSQSDMTPYEGSSNYSDVDFNAAPLDKIGLPLNMDQEPYKPECQAQSNQVWNFLTGPLNGNEDNLNFVHFYAYLQMVVDKHIGTVLDALESRPELYQNSIVFRFADHGEMGLSHGGMIEKAYNAYEETINVPLVISNPLLFRKPVQTAALASSVDLMPTIATLAGVEKKNIPTLRGVDLTPVIQDAVDHPDSPSATVQDGVLFTTDESFGSKMGYVTEPSFVRCLRQQRWKIAMYFDPNGGAESVYELYDLLNDPLEKNNLGNPNNPSYNGNQLAIMKKALQAKMEATHTTPT